MKTYQEEESRGIMIQAEEQEWSPGNIGRHTNFVAYEYELFNVIKLQSTS